MADDVIRRHGDLEIDEDPRFQDVSWSVARFGWAALVLLIVAGLAGALGHGPLSHGRAVTADGALAVVYPRVARLDSPEQIELEFRGTGPATVRFGPDFSRDFLIMRSQPEPQGERISGEGMDLEFAAAPGGAEQVAIVHLRPRRAGLPVRTSIGLRGAPPVEIATVVLP